jgi:hypothetical protein
VTLGRTRDPDRRAPPGVGGVGRLESRLRRRLDLARRRDSLAAASCSATFAALTVASLFAVAHPSAPGGGLTLDPSEEPCSRPTIPARDVYAEAVRNFGDDDVMVIGMETPTSSRRRSSKP